MSSPGSVGGARYVALVGRRVDLDDLIDAADVAVVLGLAQTTSVYVYLGEVPGYAASGGRPGTQASEALVAVGDRCLAAR